MARIRVRHPVIPPSLRGWVLVAEDGRPRFWPTVWADVLKAGAAEGTVSTHLAGIERLYKTAARVRACDDLDKVITNADFETLEAILTSFLTELRNDAAVRNVDLAPVWASALTFATTMMRHRGTSDSSVQEMSARLARLNTLYNQLSPPSTKSAAPIRALPSMVVQELREIFSPASERNPFRTEAQKFRNRLLFILYLHLGLRRGEALILSASAFQEEYDPQTEAHYRWADVTSLEHEDDSAYEDPRSVAPALKTPQSQRQLPVTKDVLELADAYVLSWRGKANHPFLFASQKGRPLAPQTVGDIFATATSRLSEAAMAQLRRRGKQSVSPHDCRHTAVVVRLKRYKDQGMDTEDALNKLRVYFGWSPTSTMPMHYARAYWQADAADALDAKFDTYVDVLRDLDSGLKSRSV